ncbi:MAG: hypothetical protein ABRQ26_13090 [Syntrophomonadaceae bacterium]
MKIASADVLMRSGHDLVQENQVNENFRFWTNDPQQDSNQANTNPITTAIQDSLEISAEAWQVRTDCTSEIQEEDLLSAQDDAKVKMIQTLLESLTGKSVRFSILRLKRYQGESGVLQAASGRAQNGQTRPNWGLSYDRVEHYREQEQSSFSAQAVIRTTDGREINTWLQLNMSREFVSHNEIHIRAGQAAQDPLVINFDAPAASLKQRNYRFDLDSDGSEEQISMLGPGSGFLALDHNGDGIINNGSELFGPQSGDGFADLAKYDGDGNGWIDENDEIWSKLRIWSVDESGQQQLVALGEKGVGAIYLGHLTTPFSINNINHDKLGQVRSSGFFLRENGVMGSMQQVDLVV